MFDTHDFTIAIDLKAREMLAEEMRSIGVEDAVVIWPDENRAYLDSGHVEDYQKVATHFHVAYDGNDPSPVNDTLLERYNDLYEEDAPEAIEKETMQIVVLSEKKPEGWAGPASWGSGTDGTEMATWQGKDGWYGCLQGQYQGNWVEGEDQGPYETREEVEKWLRSDYEENQQDEPSRDSVS